MKLDLSIVNPYSPNGTIVMDDGKLIYLVEQAYLDGMFASPCRFLARAIDDEGNNFTVKWLTRYDNFPELYKEFPELREDESVKTDCCNWNEFSVRNYMGVNIALDLNSCRRVSAADVHKSSWAIRERIKFKISKAGRKQIVAFIDKNIKPNTDKFVRIKEIADCVKAIEESIINRLVSPSEANRESVFTGISERLTHTGQVIKLSLGMEFIEFYYQEIIPVSDLENAEFAF
jgi:hypothetical protein